jgi:hypothetical protein
MSLINILEDIEEGQHIRVDCPKCHGEKTLSVTYLNGDIKYYCFRAHCAIRGCKPTIPSLDALKTRLQGRTEEKKPFQVPNYWVMGITSKKCVTMLMRSNGLEPYKQGLFKVAYDPKQDRLVYLLTKDNMVVGGIGRTLSNQKPKSLIYPGSLMVPLLIGNGKSLVLTEDCGSASSIANFPEYTGSPLLGTELKEEYIPYYLAYDKIIVSLDPDAKKKAMKLQRLLTYYHKDVNVWYTPKDFKDMTNSEIQEWMDNFVKGTIENIIGL